MHEGADPLCGACMAQTGTAQSLAGVRSFTEFFAFILGGSGVSAPFRNLPWVRFLRSRSELAEGFHDAVLKDWAILLGVG